MKWPLVSILVPCFNHERYIEESLRSVLEQDYENFELIVVNDGSTDASAALPNSHHDHSKGNRVTSKPASSNTPTA